MELRAYPKHCVSFNNVKQLKKKLHKVVHLVIYSTVKYTIFKSLLYVKHEEGYCPFTIYNFSSTDTIPKTALLQGSRKAILLEEQNAHARSERWKNVCEGNHAVILILQLSQELYMQISRVGIKKLEGNLRKEIGMSL